MNNKVVVVDDEPQIVEQVVSLLAQDGYEPITVERGGEAARVMERELPWLLILGEELPDMSGPQLLKNLGIRWIGMPDTPACSRAYGTMVLLRPNFELEYRKLNWQFPGGVDMYLSKPFHPLEFQSFVRRLREYMKNAQAKKDSGADAQ